MRTTTILLGALLTHSGCAVAASDPFDVADAAAVDIDREPVTAQDGAVEDAPPAASDDPRADAGGRQVDANVPPAPERDAGSPPATPPAPPPVDPPAPPAGNPCGAGICSDTASGDGSSCAEALTIGRTTLVSGSPEYTHSTESSGANQDLALPDCQDEGNDFFFKIYLYPGEVINLNARNRTNGHNLALKFYQATDCGAPADPVCVDQGGPSLSENLYEQRARVEGWHYIVVDGPKDAWGTFTISKNAPMATVAESCSC